MDFKYILNTKMRDLTPSQLRWVDLAANIASFPKVLFIDELELVPQLKTFPLQSLFTGIQDF